MSEELFVPKLGQTVEEVTLIGWKVQDGVKVEFGQEIMEVETDKAVFPVEANADGYIHLGPYKEGDVLPVLTVVAIIGKADDNFSIADVTPEKVASEGKMGVADAVKSFVPEKTAEIFDLVLEDPPIKFVSPRARKAAKDKDLDLWQVTPTGGNGMRIIENDVLNYLSRQAKVTPVARRIAEAEGLDLREISGSGDRGMITKADVVEAVRPMGGEKTPLMPMPASEVLERVALKGVRSIIAERMAVSVHTTARVTMFMEVDATELVKFRQRIKSHFEKEWGFAPGYNDILVKICAAALLRFPYMNARLNNDCIEHLSNINIGIAVDTERGLMVPVIRDVNRKPFQQTGSEFRQMVDRAHNRRSLPDDLIGGTFTITNLGNYGIDGFTPVINLPEAAILGIGRIVPKPVYVGDELVRREMMTLSLVFDHRLVDGAPAARFMQFIGSLVEDPAMMSLY